MERPNEHLARTPIRRARWAPVLVLVTVLVASACGTRLAQDEIVAAAAGDLAAAGTSAEVFDDDVEGLDADGEASGSATPGEGARRSGTRSSEGASGSDGDDTAGGTGPGNVGDTGGGAAENAAPKSEIVIATVGTYSGIAGNNAAKGPQALQAWAKWVNARGGVNGHPVRLLVGDDAADPARHLQLIQEMVEQKGVIAFVGNNASQTGAASKDYLNRKRVPWVGGVTYDEWMHTSPMHFPHTGAGDNFQLGIVAGTAEVAKSQGKSKAAILVCVEADSCQSAGDAYAAAAPSVGLEIVYRASVSIAQPDFTAECINARSRGAEIIFPGLDGTSVSRLARSCARQDFRPLIEQPYTGQEPVFAEDENLQGSIVPTLVYPWLLGDTPASKEFQDALSQYLPGSEPRGIMMDNWVSAKLFEAAAANLPDDPTSADVLEGLWAIDGDDLGGLTVPLRFARDKPNNHRTCYWVTMIEGGRFGVFGSTQPRCV